MGCHILFDTLVVRKLHGLWDRVHAVYFSSV